MDEILSALIEKLRGQGSLDAKDVEVILRRANREIRGPKRIAKKHLLPHYYQMRHDQTPVYKTWSLSDAEEQKLLMALRMKPRRTASGVATITVLTKPWVCSSNCIYCPNDIRMPKSYLSDEPACQRAERNFFDPFLQVVTRLRTLKQMGHTTDKIELIVLGGSWNDYPEGYRNWFIKELFRALNTCPADPIFPDELNKEIEERREVYRRAQIPETKEDAIAFIQDEQSRVHAQDITFNQAVNQLYISGDSRWSEISLTQTASLDEVKAQHGMNISGDHRVVGLVVETRPDCISVNALAHMRALGCTKIQMGIQSVDDELLEKSHRYISTEVIKEALSLIRLFGFKLHVHFMTNLLGATPEADRAGFHALTHDPAYSPDEIKLYPTALVDGTQLVAHYRSGEWHPYTEDELVSLLSDCLLDTPRFTRISRMIRDISAHDIMVGNKKVNLRQLIEDRARISPKPIREIRMREIAEQNIGTSEVHEHITQYTTNVSREYFLEYVTEEDQIAGFLRLSLPNARAIPEEMLAYGFDHTTAMIREVHVYGSVNAIGEQNVGAQHMGLGKKLIEHACELAKQSGYTHIRVISAIGTKEYYRHQGFLDDGMYQKRTL